MSCLRTFSILSSANENAVAPIIDTWGLAPNNYWVYSKIGGANTSTFNIQGFKNINIHSIEAQGDVGCVPNLGNSIIVNDWSFYLVVTGQNPIVGGTITPAPNAWSIQTQSTSVNMALNKFNPRLCFDSPIQSATNIQIQGLRASGIGAENPLNINIAWTMNFIVTYSFEGE
jgi:hypothetical protein